MRSSPYSGLRPTSASRRLVAGEVTQVARPLLSGVALRAGVPQQLVNRHPEIQNAAAELATERTCSGLILVQSITARRLNVSPNQNMRYTATVTVGDRQFTTSPVQAVLDFVNGWTLTFRDLGIAHPIGTSVFVGMGVLVQIQSECSSLQLGSARCRHGSPPRARRWRGVRRGPHR